MNQPVPDMITLTIDGRSVTVPKGIPIIEAARQMGIDIPHYCYDRDLSVVASCRLCLVEIEKVPKLQPSCSTPVADGQIVFTRSEKVLDARKMQMEFLLVQHPLDCPVCDQGGECKLQDYSRKHGMEDTRFDYRRRSFPKPDIGPLIDLERNRCILCSRCVRFMDEVAGNAELSVVQRGWKSHISTFQDQPLKNEFAGNTIDLCPVGALTSKVTRFRTRVWELKSKSAICTLCSVGCNIHLQHRNRTREILRIVPRVHDEINGRWICDAGRFIFDQFNNEKRLTRPLLKQEEGTHREASWSDAIGRTVKKLKDILGSKGGQAIAGIISPRLSNETLFLFQQFFREILSSNHIDHRTEFQPFQNEGGFLTSLALRAANQPFEEIRKADTILILGSDLPNELPILHLQVRRRSKAGASIHLAHHRPTRLDGACTGVAHYRPGSETVFLAALLKRTAESMAIALPQEVEELLAKILSPFQVHPSVELQTGLNGSSIQSLANALQRAKQSTILLGESIFNSKTGPLNVHLVAELAHLVNADPGKPSPLSLLLPSNNSRGASDMGCYPHRGPGYESLDQSGKNTEQILQGCIEGSIQALILFQCDLLEEYPNRELVKRALESVPFLVVADSLPVSTMQYADVVLPLSTLTEEEGSYTNLGGCVQRTEAAIPQLEGTLAGYQVLLALGERWGAGWRQIQPSRIFEMITEAVDHYRNMSWSGLGASGSQTLWVDISLFQSALSSSIISLFSLEESPPSPYPFRLVRGRNLFDLAGEKRFAPPWVERSEECVVEIHPEDAQRLGLESGITVTLRGSLGSTQLPVRVSTDTARGCVTLLGRYENKNINGLAVDERPWVTIQL